MASIAVISIFASALLLACGPPRGIREARETTALAPVTAGAPRDSAPPEQQPAPAPSFDRLDAIAAAERDAYANARPVFEKYCASCHTSDGAKATPKKLAHFTMDSYPFGGHHAHTIGFTVREVLGLEGEQPTMPTTAPGSVTGADLDAIAAWSRAFDRAEKAGLHGKQARDHVHRGHVPSAAAQ